MIRGGIRLRGENDAGRRSSLRALRLLRCPGRERKGRGGQFGEENEPETRHQISSIIRNAGWKSLAGGGGSRERAQVRVRVRVRAGDFVRTNQYGSILSNRWHLFMYLQYDILHTYTVHEMK